MDASRTPDGRPVLRALSVPLGVLLLMVPLLVATSWYAHVTLERGAAVQELFRDVQYGRARLGRHGRPPGDDVAILTIAFGAAPRPAGVESAHA